MPSGVQHGITGGQKLRLLLRVHRCWEVMHVLHPFRTPDRLGIEKNELILRMAVGVFRNRSPDKRDVEGIPTPVPSENLCPMGYF